MCCLASRPGLWPSWTKAVGVLSTQESLAQPMKNGLMEARWDGSEEEALALPLCPYLSVHCPLGIEADGPLSNILLLHPSGKGLVALVPSISTVLPGAKI